MHRKFFSLLFGIGLFVLMGLLWQKSRQAAFPADAPGRMDGSAPVVALTFDDGPHPAYTQLLLDGLKERGVQATFFLIGVNAKGQEAVIEQMARDGHLIGNHTYSHVQLTKISDEKACEEIGKTNSLLEEMCGQKIAYVRPPFGSWPEALDCLTDMRVVLWSVDPLDWKTQNKDRIVRHIVSHAEDGGIILLHDVYGTSVEAALEVIDTLSAEGYNFVTVDELLID